jgi:dinuclear metal center YbgI/SA1388 family protein
MKISEIVRLLDVRAPEGTAESWDNVGLLAGDPAWQTRGAVVTVDLTPEAIRLARRRKYRLIVNHHPALFGKGVQKLVPTASTSGLVFEAIRHGIAVVACHTNFDRSALEVVQAVARGLGAAPRGRLLDHPEGSLLKLVVFVPDTHVETVRQALCEAGAGSIGLYDFCTFTGRGQGSFRGAPGTKPFLGRPGELETAEETRLETVLPAGLRRPVVEALQRSHPYEEVAYDLYPVVQGPAGEGIVRGLGYGFWGDLPRPQRFADFAQGVKDLFKVDGFWMTDPVPKRVQRIAFVAGKGASFLAAAARARCELLITGEAGYHVTLDGLRRGVAVMELGHRESERFFAPTVKGWLNDAGLPALVLDLPTQKIHQLRRNSR